MKNMNTKSLFTGILLVFMVLLLSDAYSQPVSKWDQVPASIKKRNSFKRLEWFYRPRMNEQDVFPRQFIDKQKEAEYAKSQLKAGSEYLSAQWTNIGPVGIDCAGDVMVPHWGVLSGRVRGLAVHPTNPDIVYAGAASGGVWKSIDGGQNWVDKSGELNSLTFGAIAIDPSNPDVVFAGTGEYHWILTERFYSGDGLYKSTNGGDNWTKVNAEFGNVTHFSDLVISPHNPNILMAAIAKNLQDAIPNEGIWRSEDGGQHWVNVLPGEGMYDLSFHPVDANIVFAACGNEQAQAGMLMSTNGGLTFAQVNTGLPASNHIGRIQFDISVSNPSVMYAVIFDKYPLPGGMTTSVYKSVDGGALWNQISEGINLCEFSDQGFYDLCIAVDPTNPDHVFMGNVEFIQSTNGETFTPVRNPGGPGGGIDPFDSYTHLDHHIIRFAPTDPSIIYVGCDGGVFKSTDSGASFFAMNTDINTIQSYRVASHTSNPDILYTGAQDNGFVSTHDRGATPYKLELLGDGTECFVDYSNPDIIFFATIGGYFGRSANGGQSWDLLVDPITLNDSSAFLCPYWQHPTNPEIIYGCLKQKLYKSTDKGLSWEYTTTSPIVGSAIYSAAQSPINPNNIMVAARNGETSLVRSSDGGISWQDISGNLGELSGGNFMRLQADPFDGNTFYLLKNAYSGAIVVKTTNFGTTWTDISSNLPKVPVNDIFIDEENAGVMYLGNDFGVYRTDNSGESWERMNNGMPFVPMLDFDCFNFDDTRLLRAATYGRGIFELDLEAYSSVNEDFFNSATIKVWPNPASDRLWIELSAITPANYILSLTTINGQLVASKRVFTNGTMFLTYIDISQLKSGSYQLIFTGNETVQTVNVIIVR